MNVISQILGRPLHNVASDARENAMQLIVGSETQARTADTSSLIYMPQ